MFLSNLTRRGFIGTAALTAAASLAACSQPASSASSSSASDSIASSSSETTTSPVVIQTSYGPVAGIAANGVRTWWRALRCQSHKRVALAGSATADGMG